MFVLSYHKKKEEGSNKNVQILKHKSNSRKKKIFKNVLKTDHFPIHLPFVKNVFIGPPLKIYIHKVVKKQTLSCKS